MSDTPQPLPFPPGPSGFHGCVADFERAMAATAEVTMTGEALRQPDAEQAGIVLSGVKLICDYLLAAEANCLCGVEPGAPLPSRANACADVIVNWRKCSLRTATGVITLRLPVLRLVHSRPSMPKRFRRLQAMLLATARSTHEDGVSRTGVEALVKTMWTLSLSDDLLACLACELCRFLDAWRKAPAFAVRFSGPTPRNIRYVHAQAALTQSALIPQPPPRAWKIEAAQTSENDCAII